MELENSGVETWATELYQAYVFDMDGTLYLGDDLLPGAKRMLEELRRLDLPVRFLSNNPTKNPRQYLEKLEDLGFHAELDEIASTVVTTVRWLKRNHPQAVIFPIAEAPLVDALEEAGFTISEDPSEIDIVIASYDRGFDYQKLQIAFDAIWFHKRAFLIATNPDRFCPFPGGRGEPDCASIIAAVEACTGVKCREVIGKPNPIMLREALGDLEVDLRKVVMVGDRLHTDIEMAVNAQMASAMTLTGESTWEEVMELQPERRPTMVLDRVDKLIPKELWEENNWVED